jgi:hypothetical protein
VQLLTADEAARWCGERGIPVTKTGALSTLNHSGPEQHRFRAAIDVAPSQLLAMAHSILLQDLAQPAEDDFAGALVWLREWDIWSESVERAGLRLADLTRAAFAGTSRPLAQAPAQLFDPREFVDAQIATTLPFLFQWDAYVVPVSGRCFTLVSHDGYLMFSASNASILKRAYRRFEAVNWHPEPDVIDEERE